jgi:hypothetical protein
LCFWCISNNDGNREDPENKSVTPVKRTGQVDNVLLPSSHCSIRPSFWEATDEVTSANLIHLSVPQFPQVYGKAPYALDFRVRINNRFANSDYVADTIPTSLKTGFLHVVLGILLRQGLSM